jgi:acid phosphatase (class A)
MMMTFTNRSKWRRLLLALLSVAAIVGCANFDGAIKPTDGYLSHQALPNGFSVLPPPPVKGSAALTLDDEIERKSFALKDTSRWFLAISDADLTFPHAADTFSCALDIPITKEDTPHLYMLLSRTLTDLSLSTSAAKCYYHRTRPFAQNKKPLCTPDEKAALEKNGSYPSGHAAIGWGWALILSEISPEQTDAILARGRAFGESRIVCNVHWYSDVVQSRLIAAGTVARLHDDPAFLTDLEAAKAELATVRNKGLKPTRNCRAEEAALAIKPSVAQ